MKKAIIVGDKVDVHFTTSPSLINCEVIHIPCDTGDSWELRDEFGTLHYVCFFERMDEIPELDSKNIPF